jgi:murein DD-endopeptidase MepM/ murein hydrolase activator NlpD
MAVSSRRPRATTGILVAAVAIIVLCGPAPAAAAPSKAVNSSSGLSPAWVWPVTPPHQVQRAFEAPPTPYGAGHRGIDLTATAGSAVSAAADGVVSFAGMVVDRPVLSVRHDDGLVASGGHCDGRCVHFGVRLHGEYVNPMALLATLERAVLLPLGR